MVKADWIKPGAVVIDVGINSLDDETSKKGWVLQSGGGLSPVFFPIPSFFLNFDQNVAPVSKIFFFMPPEAHARDQSDIPDFFLIDVC